MKRLFFILACLIFLLLGGGAWFLLLPHEPEQLTSPLQPTVPVSPTPRPLTPTGALLERDTKAIKTLVTDFYAAYQTCLSKPPPQAVGKVSGYCQARTGLSTTALVENLRQGGTARRGADPVTCSQNPPASVTAGEIDYEAPDRAVATAITAYGAGFAQKIPVVVVKEAAGWRVDNVTCPRP